MDAMFWCWLVLVGVVGLCVGSFLNVVIYRVPLHMSLSYPASHCTSCNYKLAWYDNVPLISYVFLRGKCRKCKEHISLRYPLVELLNMALWLASFALFYNKNLAVAILFLPIMSTLVCIALIDLDYQYIPDRLQIILLLAVLPLCFLDDSVSWAQRGLGAGLTLAFMALVYGGCYLVTKREGVGIGDIKLLVICGLMLGIWKIFLSVLISSTLASIVLIIVMAVRNRKTANNTAETGALQIETQTHMSQGLDNNTADKTAETGALQIETQADMSQSLDTNIADNTAETNDEKTEKCSKEYPFAPFLVIGFVIAMLFGDKIITLYLSLF